MYMAKDSEQLTGWVDKNRFSLTHKGGGRHAEARDLSSANVKNRCYRKFKTKKQSYYHNAKPG